MLTTFCSRYPQGSLISELLQIEHGQYIVRVSVVIEGKTLTGLAMAATVEAAEDQARLRALGLLNLDSETEPTPEKHDVPVVTPKTQAKTKIEKSQPPLTLVSPEPEILAPIVHQAPTPLPDFPPEPEKTATEPEPQLELESERTEPEPQLELESERTEPEPQLELESERTEPEPQLEPESAIDFNQVMAQIDVEMKRLKWTKEEGRDYLRSTYGKTSRIQLNDSEIFEFLNYLKTQ